MLPKKLKKTKRSLLIIAGIFLLIILSAFGFFGFFKNSVSFVTQPAQSAFQGIARGVNNFYSVIFERESLITKSKEMEAQLQNYAIDYVELEAVKQENEKLKIMFDYLETQDFQIIAAKVLTFINSPNDKSVLINKGGKDGVALGMTVMEGEGLVIGRIANVEDHLAWVRLITDPRSKIPVRIMGEDKTIGIGSGTYGSLLKMELVPQQEKIKVDDLVVTSNLEPGIPQDLLVGVINQIDAPGNEPFKTAIIEPMTSFEDIKMVSVIIFPIHD